MIFINLVKNYKMSIQKFINQIASKLNQLEIPYVISGGIAVSIWGKPRHTADVDIVIEINSSEKVVDLIKALKKEFPKSYSDEKMALDAFNRKSEFNIIEPEYGLKADFFFTKGEFQQQEIKRGKNIKVDDRMIRFISPEDLIISKLKWYKEGQSTRQLEDIKSVMDIQNKLDQRYLVLWINKLGLKKEWEKLEKLNG